MTVLDLLRVCRGVSIGMHAQRKASVGWKRPVGVIYSNLVPKADYHHHQYIWSSVNLSCLVMKTPRNGSTEYFLHWCPCEELFSETEPLKGQVFFSVTFYYGAPPAITKMNFTVVITVRALQKDVAVRVSLCLFFTKLCKPSFLNIFLQGMLSLTSEGPLLVNCLWDTIFFLSILFYPFSNPSWTHFQMFILLIWYSVSI